MFFDFHEMMHIVAKVFYIIKKFRLTYTTAIYIGLFRYVVITFRPLKTFDHDLLSTDIGKIDFNFDSKMLILLLTIITLFLLHYWINIHH